MAKKLYPLRNVPEDEADEMRALLRENQIEFHETNAGMIGIGTAAIWINNEAQFEQAKQLIIEYQQQRYQTAREQYTAQKSANQHRQLGDIFKQSPAKFIFYCMLAIGLILLSTMPFWL